jgi:hypothetical protein
VRAGTREALMNESQLRETFGVDIPGVREARMSNP